MNESSEVLATNNTLESRRDFLKIAGTALALLGLASVGLADDNGGDDEKDDDDGNRSNLTTAVGKGMIDLGPVSSYKPGSVTDKTAQAGVIISRTAKGLIALAPVCTHQGCAPKYSSAATQFVCPCHAARFTTDGAVTAGPARTPLSRYPLQIKNGRLIVDTNKLLQRSSVKASDFVKV